MSLFSSFDLKSLHLKNRFAMAPMTREFSPDGVAGPDVAEYYRKRAAGGVSLIITEGTYIPDPAAGPYDKVPLLYGEDSLAGWKSVVEAVHGEGGQIVPQLWHLGVQRGSTPDFNPDVPTVSPSGLTLTGKQRGRAIETNEIDQLIAWYVEAAINAKNVGFDGVELHGAHGYLLDQFMWEVTNQRADGFGGTEIADRIRVPLEVVKAIRSELGDDFPIIYRFSQWKGGLYDARLAVDPAALEKIVVPLVEAGTDILHVSTRRFWDPAFPEIAGEDGELTLAAWTKRLTNAPVITVGSVGLNEVFTTTWTPNGDADVSNNTDELERLFERGDFDLVAVGRALLSDPEWVDKYEHNKVDEAVPYTNHYREVLV